MFSFCIYFNGSVIKLQEITQQDVILPNVISEACGYLNKIHFHETSQSGINV